MKFLTELLPKKTVPIVNSLHCWIIAFIIITISILYYLPFIPGYYYWLWNNLRWLWFLEVFETTHGLHGILFFIPLIYAVLVSWWRGVAIVWLITMIIMLPRIIYWSSNLATSISNILFLIVPILVLSSIALQLNWREKERKALAEREGERKNYLGQIITSQESERQRISRELHDDSIQRLWVLANRARNITTPALIHDYPEQVDEIKSITDEILYISNDMKRLSLALRPSILDELGLIPALRHLVHEFDKDHLIETRLLVRGEQNILNDQTSISLFRITQEALNNVKRHSKASRASVTIEFGPKVVKLTIQDDGIGFTLPQKDNLFTIQNKLGLMNMKQRALFLNGTFNINTAINKGTQITVVASL